VVSNGIKDDKETGSKSKTELNLRYLLIFPSKINSTVPEKLMTTYFDVLADRLREEELKSDSRGSKILL
jgi:hypothetical protein